MARGEGIAERYRLVTDEEGSLDEAAPSVSGCLSLRVQLAARPPGERPGVGTLDDGRFPVERYRRG